jgi:hypothetical protein
MHQAALAGTEGVESRVYGMPRQPVHRARMANWQMLHSVYSDNFRWNIQVSQLP